MRERKMPLNEQTKNYMLKMIAHFRNYKLSMKETVQLFQDLADSELIWELPIDLQQYALDLSRNEMIRIEYKDIGELQ